MANIDATTPQLKILKEFAEALISRRLTDAEPILSKDFILKTFPKSPEIPDLGKEEYFKGFGAKLALFAKVEITFHDVIEAPGKVVAHHTTLFTTAEGTKIDYECVLILSFVEEDGKLKVLEVKDFTDLEKRKVCNADAANLQPK